MIYEITSYNLDEIDSIRSNEKIALESSKNIYANIEDSCYRCLEIANSTEDLVEIVDFADKWEKKFSDIVIIGTGGSSLGAAAIISIKLNLKNKCNFHFLGNLDNESILETLNKIDIAKTGILLISKSGSTVEVLCQALVFLELLEKSPKVKDISTQVAVITSNKESPLYNLATSKGFKIFYHESSVPGRYSIFTNVGCLPAAIAGHDIEALRQGGLYALRSLTRDSFPPALGAGAMSSLINAGIKTNIMFPYDCRLQVFCNWHRQLWAESLGKDGKGMTPAPALGPVDQHSQLQLWLDGPMDKVVNVILIDSIDKDFPINSFNYDGLAYLSGKNISDVNFALASSTIQVLIEKHIPLRVIKIKNLDDYTLGALFMHFMIETILTAQIIDVDPFDQPAVEKVKILVKENLLQNI
tara:strand:- start:643 stop:1884 length:1242 start_codon:yes stop_codon:yes gene_type:complete